MQPFWDILRKYYTKYIKMSSKIKQHYINILTANKTMLHNCSKDNQL